MKSLLWCWLVLLSFGSGVSAQSTAFHYQGRLLESAVPVTGTVEFQATLWSAASSGAQVAAHVPEVLTASVVEGSFVLALDFGAAPFGGGPLWLQLGVRSGPGPFTTLSPRQPLLPAPYAIAAGRVNGPVPAAQLSGTLAGASLDGSYPGILTFANPANRFAGDGSGLDKVNAAALDGLSSAGFWSTNGNAGADPARGAFLGTRDAQPLELHVFSERVLRLEVAGNSPNVIGGHRFNVVSNGLIGATIAGGGSADLPHRVGENFATVPGGEGNRALGRASTAMGFHTTARGAFATAAGADSEAAGNSAVALGSLATASGDYALALGRETTASGEYASALGWGTSARALGATALGVATEADGERSFAAGFVTVASGFCATAFGRGSTAAGDYSFAAGRSARALHPGAFVWADDSGGTFASTGAHQFLLRAVGGVGIGTGNPQANLHLYSADNPTVVRLQSTGTPGFGRLEFVSNPQGDVNEWRPGYIQSTDAGGFTGGLAFFVNGSGPASKFAATEVMRLQNGSVGIGTAAPAGRLHVVGDGSNAAIAGYSGSIHSAVYGENTSGGFGVSGRTTGSGYAVYGDNANAAGYAGYFNGNVRVTGTINPPSDRNVKHDFASVDARGVLEKVAALSIQTWAYTNDARRARHLGPVAQDFKAAFGLGADDKSIATVDADGVALAAIQGLNQKLETRSQEAGERLHQLAAENAALQARIEQLEKLISKLDLQHQRP